MCKVNVVILFLLILSSTNQLSAGNIDSLLIALVENEKNEQEWEQLYLNYFELGKNYRMGGNEEYELGAQYYTKAYQIAKSHGDVIKEADCLYGIGICYQRRNDYQKSMEAYMQIIDLGIEQEKSNTKADAYTQIAAIHQALGDYKKAFDNQMQALLICEINGHEFGIANSHYNLGGIFFYQNQYQRALEHYEKAKIICDKLQNNEIIYACLAALGSVHDKLGNTKKSLDYNKKSLNLAEKLNYKTGIAYAKGNIASNYLGQQKFVDAEKLFKEAIDMQLTLSDKYGAIGNYIGLATTYLDWDKPAQAIPILQRALHNAVEVSSKVRQAELYRILALAYEQLDNLAMAYINNKQYMILKDSLINEKTLEEMGQSQRRYDVEKKENEIALLKKENELLGKNKKIQKLQFYILAVSSLALLLFIWWYKNKLKYQSELNKMLEEKNGMLNVMNEEIEIKNKQLEHSNEDLKQFAYVASHDLKEPLRMIHSYVNLLQRRYDSMFDSTGKEFMFYVTDAVTRMQTLLDDLLDFSRAGAQTAPTDFVSVADVLVVVEANLRHRLQTLNASLEINDDCLPAIKAHRTQLIQLLQNLVSNGIKFKGARDPKVIVSCEKREKVFVYSVKDNGIGISKENLEKVFEMFRRLHTRDEYEGTGIGLATCKRIVTTWGGDIWVESSVNVGSTFFFSVPISMAQLEQQKQLSTVEA